MNRLVLAALIVLPAFHASADEQSVWRFAGARSVAPLTRESYYVFSWDGGAFDDTAEGLDISGCEEVAYKWDSANEEGILDPCSGLTYAGEGDLKECATKTTAIGSCTKIADLDPPDMSGVSCVGSAFTERMRPSSLFRAQEEWRTVKPTQDFLKVDVVSADGTTATAYPIKSSLSIRCRTKERRRGIGPQDFFQDWTILAQDFTTEDQVGIETERCADSFSSSCTDSFDTPACPAAGVTQTSLTTAVDGYCDAPTGGGSCKPAGVCNPAVAQTTGSPDGLCDSGCQVRGPARPWAYTLFDASTDADILQATGSNAPYRGHAAGGFRGMHANSVTGGATFHYLPYVSEAAGLGAQTHYGEPREIVWWADVGFLDNPVTANFYFAGFLKPGNGMFNTDGTIDSLPTGSDGDSAGQCLGFWFDSSTGNVYVVIADSETAYAPLDTGFDFGANTAFRLRMEISLHSVAAQSLAEIAGSSSVRFYVNDVEVLNYRDWTDVNAIYLTDGIVPGFGHYLVNGTRRLLRVANWGVARSIAPHKVDDLD